MNVPGRREAQAAGELRAQVADNVAKKIAGDDDVKLARVADKLHRQRIDIQVAGIDVRVFLPDLLKNPLPEIVRKGHGVGFVAHTDALQAVQARVFERIADDALHAFAGVHVFLNGDLVRCVLLKEPSDAHVEAGVVLSELHEANVFFGPIAQRSEPVVEQLDGSGVDVEIELEAQPQKDIGSMLIRRDARITERAKENGIKFIAQHFDSARRQAYSLAKILICAPVKPHKFQRPLSGRRHRLQHLHGLRRDLRPDAVAWYYSDSCG